MNATEFLRKNIHRYLKSLGYLESQATDATDRVMEAYKRNEITHPGELMQAGLRVARSRFGNPNKKVIQ